MARIPSIDPRASALSAVKPLTWQGAGSALTLATVLVPINLVKAPNVEYLDYFLYLLIGFCAATGVVGMFLRDPRQ